MSQENSSRKRTRVIPETYKHVTQDVDCGVEATRFDIRQILSGMASCSCRWRQLRFMNFRLTFRFEGVFRNQSNASKAESFAVVHTICYGCVNPKMFSSFRKEVFHACRHQASIVRMPSQANAAAAPSSLAAQSFHSRIEPVRNPL